MQVKQIRIVKNGNNIECDYNIEKIIVTDSGQLVSSKKIDGMALIDILQTELLPFFEEKEIEARWIE